MVPEREDKSPSEVQFLARTKSFTRRSRDLSPALERQFRRFADAHLIEVPRDIGFTTVAPDFRLDCEAVFGRQSPLVVEVGSGRGEQMLQAATDHPEWNFLAFEVWVPGVARLVAKAGENHLDNIRVIEADAALALQSMIAPGTVSELWTFFPDPWRKTKHHKRRLVGPAFMATAARVLAGGGSWRMATDWPDYALSMLQVTSDSVDFVNSEKDVAPQFALGQYSGDIAVPDPATGGFAPRFPGRVQTHFEQRGEKAGRPSWDLHLIRTAQEAE